MSNVMEKYKEEARKRGYAEALVEAYAESYAEGYAEGVEIGVAKANLTAIRNMIKHGVPREKIEQIYPKEDIEKAIEQMKNEEQ